MVSIPHRYGKNVGITGVDWARIHGFPFLIGTVRTHVEKER